MRNTLKLLFYVAFTFLAILPVYETQAQIITTVAGNGSSGTGPDGVPATTSPLGLVYGISSDATGAYYLCDYGSNLVRKVDAAGIITTFAGTGATGYAGDGGPAVSAWFGSIFGIAIDAAGNVFVSDGGNHCVRKISTSGIITTVAGTPTIFGYTGDGGAATAATFEDPRGLAFDAGGNLYIADFSAGVIRKVNTSGIISTFAGDGSGAFSGDGLPATAAGLASPLCVATDAAGNVYIGSYIDDRVRKVNSLGIISTYAGTGVSGYFGDAGPATNAQFDGIFSIATDPSGNLFIADFNNNRVRKVNGAGVVTSIAGTGTPGYSGDGGPATSALMHNPQAVGTDASGSVYISDIANYVIRKVTYCSAPVVAAVVGPNNVCNGNTITLTDATPSGTWTSANTAIATVTSGGVVTGISAGNVLISYTVTNSCGSTSSLAFITVGQRNIATYAGGGSVLGDGGPATAAQLKGPNGCFMDASGNVYIPEFTGHRIRKINPAGIITTVAGTGVAGYSGDTGPATNAQITSPTGVFVTPSGFLYIADYDNNRIRKVSPSGIITTIAGIGTVGFSGDGFAATAAQLYRPSCIFVDSIGTVYFTDGGNSVVRKINTSGIISTIAGIGGIAGYSGDGGPATLAKLYNVFGITMDKTGNIYLGDHLNHRMRVINTSGIISTFAGTGTSGYSGDGAAATLAKLNTPQMAYLDPANNILIADEFNNVIRYINSSGIISTIAGTTVGFSGDGGPATAAKFNNTADISMDAAGNIYVADFNNNRIRKISPVNTTVAAIAGTSVLCQGTPYLFTDATPGGTWATSNSTVATVGSSNGEVIGVNAGTATITYSVSYACGTVIAVMPVTVNAYSAGTISGASGVCIGNAISLTDATPGGTWSSSNTAVATVTSGGVVSGISAGYAVISYTLSTSCGTIAARHIVAVGDPIVNTIAGTGVASYSGEGVPATSAQIQSPTGMVMDGSGNLYFADRDNNRVRKITASGIITTVAGNGSPTYGGDGGQATAAQVHSPMGIALDPAGNLLFAEWSSNVIRKVNLSTGIISTVAGTGFSGFSGDGVAATASKLNNPRSLCIDPAGNIYIADGGNNRIRKVDLSGTISTVVGTGAAGFAGDGGMATAAQLNFPYNVYIDPSGIMYVCDEANYRIRKVDQAGIISTIAGTGLSFSSGDGGPATAATLVAPSSVVMNAQGDLIIGDNITRVRQISGTTGIISTIAGTSFGGYGGDGGSPATATFNSVMFVYVDPSSNTYIADYNMNRIRKIAPVANTVAPLTGPSTVCLGSTITLADVTSGGTWSSSAPAVASVGSTGIVTGLSLGVATISYTVAYACGNISAVQLVTVNAASGSVASIAGPAIVCPGNTITLTDATSGGTWSSSSLTVATVGSTGIVTGITPGYAVISYSVSGGCGSVAAKQLITVGNPIVTTIAGNGTGGYVADGVAATATAINGPSGTVMDGAGNIYFSDYYNNRIRKINTAGIISTVAGTGLAGYTGDGGPATLARVQSPSGIALDPSGNVVWAEYNNSVIRKLTVSSGIISTITGIGFSGFLGDGGPASSARINHPPCVYIDPAGVIYVPDAGNQRIRKIDLAGNISTIAGTGTAGYTGDGVPATSTRLNNAFGLCTDAAGNLYIADQTNNRIRKVDPTGIITTIAGTGVAGFSGDGGAATLAKFNGPTGVFLDPAGNLLVADRNNYVVRQINLSTGIITTIAGTNVAGYSGDGGSPATAQFRDIPLVYLDSVYNLYISDFGNNRIRKVSPVSPGVAVITGTPTVCVGATTTLADVTPGGTWSSSTPLIATVGSGTGVVTGIASGVTTITYSVVYNCGTMYSVQSVTVNPLPAVPAAITGPTTICTGSPVTLNDATSGGTWSSTLTSVATIGSGSGTLTGLTAGITTISYTVSNACGINAAVRFDTVVTAPGSITGTTAFCVGATSSLGNTTGGGTWTSGNSAIATIGSLSGLATGVAPGNTTITYTTGGVCTVSVVLTISPTPAAITPAGSVTLCAGATTTLADIVSGGTWSSASTGIATVGSTGIVTGVAAGTVNISYTTGAGCSVVKPVTVLVTPAPLSPSSASVCTGNTITFTESVGGGIWSSVSPGVASVAGGVVTGVAVGSTSISYTIGSCAVGAPVTVNASPAGITPATAVSFCVGATASLADVTPGGTWSSGATGIATVGSTGTVTGVSAGTVTISYTTGAGCSAVKPVTVLVSPAALSPVSATVCTGNTVSFTEAIGGGIWSSASPAVASVAGGIVTGVAVGITTISYTIGTCYATAPVTVNLSPAAGVISGPSTVCTGTPVAFTDGAPGGVWSSSNAAVVTIGSSGLATGVTAGSATISYSVTNGCGTAVATKSVTVSISATAGTIVGSSSVCAGTYTTLSDATPGGVWSSTNSNATISSGGLLVGVTPGTDTILYSVTNACGTVSASKVITVGPFLSAGTISGPTSVCAGAAITLTDPVPGGVWTASNTAASVMAGVVSGLTSGADTIYYTITSSCGAAIASHVVTVIPLPDAGIITGPVVLCAGAIATYTETATGGYWGVTNPTALISGAGVVTAMSPGTDTITYTVTNACGTASTYQVLTIGAAISAGSITGPSSVCQTATITLTDAAPGGVWSASNANAAVSGGVVTGLLVGADTISYTVTSSCGSVSASAVIVINPLADAGTVSGPSSLCIGSPVTYTDPAPGGVWSVSNSTASISMGGVVTPLSAGLDTISYSVTNSCGTAVATQTVNIVIVPVAGTITGPATVCAGTSITLVDAVPGGVWAASNGNASVVGGLVTGIAPGLDTITYTVSTGCGTAIATRVINVTNVPSPGTITGPSGVCVGSVVILSDTAIGGAWSASNGDATITTSGIVTGIAPGIDTISYTVTNSCGSFATTQILTVSASMPSAGIISGPASVCVGGTITLTDPAPGGVWGSSNATATVAGGIVTGLAAGVDTISYVVTNGCGAATATAVVTVGSALSAGTIVGPASVCVGASVSLSDAVAGGVWSSSNSSATVTGGVVTGVSAGVDTIYYTVSGSCGSATASHIITIGLMPSAGTITGPTGVCAGATITLVDAVPGGIWSATNTRATVSGGVVTGVLAGLDTIRYTVSNACGSAVASRAVAINSLPSAGSIAGAPSVCPAATTLMTDAVSGGVWSSSNTGVASISGAGVVTGVSAGTVMISYTVSNSCGHTSTTHSLTVLTPSACSGLQVNNVGSGINEQLKVAPNPNGGAFTMNLVSDNDEPVHVVITNVLGEKVKEFMATTNRVVDLQLNEAAGMYLLTATTANGKFVAKVIIN